jgi:APA family basic amino acid/polyamine antiporter
MTKESVWLPEESFQSFPNYKTALFAMLQRLRDRVLARANVQEEMEMKARSGNTMKQTLNWWDLMWFGVGAVIGADIFVITGQEANRTAGPAIIISYTLARISAMLSVFCYTEVAVEIPVAGKLFVFSANLLLTDNNPILPFDQNPILETSNVQNPKLQKQEEEVKIS